MKKTILNIIFSTVEIANVVNLLDSIHKTYNLLENKSYSLVITILDKTIEQNISSIINNNNFVVDVVRLNVIYKLEKKYLEYFNSANCSINIDSIQRARIQQQIYILENYNFFRGSIVWQVDDDILFGRSSYSNDKHIVNYSFDYFSKIVQFYECNTDIDAIIAPTTYVPPIPSLLYSRTQLENFFYGKLITEDSNDLLEYHDFYSQKNDLSNYSLFLSETYDKNSVAKDILKGKPVTKVASCSATGENIEFKKSSLLRGGNFIVFNTDIFKIPHLGFKESENIPARRSDMIHAKLLFELDYKIVDINYFSIVHNRLFNKASIDSSAEKYLSDMVGALLIQHLFNGKSEFENRLKFHQNHIKKILVLLYDNIDKNVFKYEIDRLIELDFKINSFDEDHFLNKFEDFRTNMNYLKLKICKLVS